MSVLPLNISIRPLDTIIVRYIYLNILLEYILLIIYVYTSMIDINALILIVLLLILLEY